MTTLENEKILESIKEEFGQVIEQQLGIKELDNLEDEIRDFSKKCAMVCAVIMSCTKDDKKDIVQDGLALVIDGAKRIALLQLINRLTNNTTKGGN